MIHETRRRRPIRDALAMGPTQLEQALNMAVFASRLSPRNANPGPESSRKGSPGEVGHRVRPWWSWRASTP